MIQFFRTCACLIVLITALVGSPTFAEQQDSGSTLVIQNPQNDQQFRFPINDLRRLTIRFFHSFDRQWVEESFRIEDDRFVPIEVMFKDDSYDYRHQRYKCRQVFERHQDRLMDIEPLPSDKLQVIRTRIAYTRSQLLILEDAHQKVTYRFYTWGLPGQLLVFSIES